MVLRCRYLQAEAYLADGQHYATATLFYPMGDFADAKERSTACWKEITKSAAPISCGDCYAIGLRTDGTVAAAGRNSEGQCNVSGWNDIVAVDVSFIGTTVGLKADGSVVAAGKNDEGQCNAANWRNIRIPE